MPPDSAGRAGYQTRRRNRCGTIGEVVHVAEITAEYHGTVVEKPIGRNRFLLGFRSPRARFWRGARSALVIYATSRLALRGM